MNASLRYLLFACLPLAIASASVPHAAWAQEVQLDRSVLPVPEPARPPITEIDARDAQVPPRFEVKAPAGAPNVVIVLIDDLGFGVPDAFGGPIRMATLDKLAQDGLRYTNFHTTALCSPTRAALFPNVPTLKEATGSNWATGAWRGIAAPKGLPNDVRVRLEAAVKKVWDSKEFKDFMAQRGFGVLWGNGEEFARFMAKGDGDMKAVMTAVGIAK
jgi:hypothetical protein